MAEPTMGCYPTRGGPASRLRTRRLLLGRPGPLNIVLGIEGVGAVVAPKHGDAAMSIGAGGHGRPPGPRLVVNENEAAIGVLSRSEDDRALTVGQGEAVGNEGQR